MGNTESNVSDHDILAILRAADKIIARGGRSLLAKILKGSKDKKVLELGLDQCPVYGYFRDETLKNILKKVDWMIDYDFFDIEYVGKLPMIVFTERGWEIHKDQYTDELLQECEEWLEKGIQNPDMTYLKDRDRGMISLLLEKIGETRDKRFIPYLKEWEKVDYKKVKAKIRQVIQMIESDEQLDHEAIHVRQMAIKEALQGEETGDLRLKCWDCGKRFTFSIDEQRFFKQKGYSYPKSCKSCRGRRKN